MRIPKHPTPFAASVAMLACLAARPASAADDPAAAAKAIFDATGIKGGLVVHLGCGDGSLTAALGANEGTLVHGLDRDPANVEKARAQLAATGLYGPASIDRLSANTLPYTDNLVNLLVAEDPGDIPQAEMLRVMVPNGVAYVKRDGQWSKSTKPRPSEMDDWTHYLHNPSNNAVSKDRLVGFLRQLQWIGGPRYSRHHDHMSSASAMVSAGGRLFYIFDHASSLSIQLPSKWELVARDAFNGAVLWRRNIDQWHTQMWKLKSGPAHLPRRVVAADDTVYATLSLNAPVSALDAATGKTLRTYEGTQGTEEILVSDGQVFAVVNPAGPKPGAADGPYESGPESRRVVAVSADSGQLLWKKDCSWVAPVTLTLDAKRALFFDGERVVALDRKNGKELWRSQVVGNKNPLFSYFAPCLVVADGIALFSGGDSGGEDYHHDHGTKMTAFDAATGKTLWSAPHPPGGYRSAEDILVINGTVWTGDLMNAKETKTDKTGTIYGYELRTGKLKAEFQPDVDTHWFHHRCYRAKATEKYLLTSRTGIEFIDLDTKHWTCHHWVRGACLYGIMPANGMVYNPPHPCACYLESKLYGYNALAPHSTARQKIIDAQDKSARIEKGPAFSEIGDRPSSIDHREDWPTLRADIARSGSVATQVPPNLAPAWRAKIGGRLSSPVVANGRLFVAAIDAHKIHALDATSGKTLWTFTAGGRVDSPPTIWQGRALFGSRDGYLYCLRAEDGQLAWRYRAAPADLRMGAFDQIESVWPLHGSVLVHEPKPGKPELWCVAGRSMFLDGGLRLLRIDPATGAKIAEKILDDRVPDTNDNLQILLKTLNMPVALNDVLVSDGKSVYMKSQQFDFQGNRVDITTPTLDQKEQKGETAHLFCPTGLLDDTWWHRSYWLFGRVWKSGAGGYYQSGRFAPAGRPLVFDDDNVYSFGRKPEYYRWTTPMEYMLFASAKQPENVSLSGDAAANKGKAKKKKDGAAMGAMPTNTIKTDWKTDVPILTRAMVLADKTLFVAGPPDLFDEKETLATFDSKDTQALLARQAAAIGGAEGAILRAVSATDGKILNEQKLDALPVFDGMIAANEKIFYSTVDGQVVALGGKP